MVVIFCGGIRAGYVISNFQCLIISISAFCRSNLPVCNSIIISAAEEQGVGNSQRTKNELTRAEIHILSSLNVVK